MSYVSHTKFITGTCPGILMSLEVKIVKFMVTTVFMTGYICIFFAPLLFFGFYFNILELVFIEIVWYLAMYYSINSYIMRDKK